MGGVGRGGGAVLRPAVGPWNSLQRPWSPFLLSYRLGKYNLLPACKGWRFWVASFFFSNRLLRRSFNCDTSTFDGREKVKKITLFTDLQDFLYDMYTGLNALKQKNVKYSKWFEKCISILTYFIPTLMILRMSLHNDPLWEYTSQRESLCFQMFRIAVHPQYVIESS